VPKRHYTDLPLAWLFSSEVPEEGWPSAVRRATKCNVYPSSKSLDCQGYFNRVVTISNQFNPHINVVPKQLKSIN
jgi:hypothetical protein